MYRTAGGLRVLGLIQARNLVPFRKLVLPAVPRWGIPFAGRYADAGRWAFLQYKQTFGSLEAVEQAVMKGKAVSKSISDAIFEARLRAMDDGNLVRWPVPYELLSVPTRYGKTHIIASGNQDAPPLVLLHAMGVTSTMWLPNFAALSRDHRAYALDTIGDQGKSTLYQPDLYPKNGQAYSEWLVDVFNEIGISQADLIGSSYGGWIAVNHAIYAADRVERIVLLGPMGLPSWLTTLKVLSHLWPVMLFPTESNINKIIRWALGDNPSVREAFADYLAIGANRLSTFKLVAPLPLFADQLQKIKSPTLVMLGEHDKVIGNAREVAKHAQQLIPHVEVEIIPAAGHMMNTECPEFVNSRMLRFLLK